MVHRFGPVQDPALADLALLLPPRQTLINTGFQGSDSLLDMLGMFGARRKSVDLTVQDACNAKLS